MADINEITLNDTTYDLNIKDGKITEQKLSSALQTKLGNVPNDTNAALEAQAVSVSQNTQTGGVDIKVGGVAVPNGNVASQSEVNAMKLAKSVSSVGSPILIPFIIEAYMSDYESDATYRIALIWKNVNSSTRLQLKKTKNGVETEYAYETRYGIVSGIQFIYLGNTKLIVNWDTLPDNYSIANANIVFNSQVGNFESTNEIFNRYLGATFVKPSYTTTSGYFISRYNEKRTSPSYSITSPIELKTGDRVNYLAVGTTEIAIIAKTNSTGDTFTSLVVSAGLSDYSYKTYVATEDCYIIMSFFTSTNLYVSIYRQEDKAQIAENKAYIEQLRSLSMLGKTIVCFGDSITEFGDSFHKRYSNYIAEKTGATCINVGVGGSTFKQRATPTVTPTNENEARAALDIVNMIDAACSQNFTKQDAAGEWLENAGISASGQEYQDIVDRLKAVDWTKVDAITILGGTNDFHHGGERIGDEDSTDVNYTWGAVNHIIASLGNAFPKIKVYFITPLVRYIDPYPFSVSKIYHIGDMVTYSDSPYRFIAEHSAGAWNSSEVESITKEETRTDAMFGDMWENSVGMTLRDFCKTLERVVTTNNHIPTFDAYNMGWTKFNFWSFFISADGTHPLLGFEWLGEKISKYIISH